MKIIYDNIIFSLQKSGGISIYWYELIKRILHHKEAQAIFYEINNKNIFRKEIEINTKMESRLHFKILRYLPFLEKLPTKSIFHSSYYRVSLQKDVANILTVHDFIYEYFRNGLAKSIHTCQKNISIWRSDGIICVSENTKKDLINFYPNVDIEKIKVIYNGVSDDYIPLDQPECYLLDEFEVLRDKKYILYVGDRSNYKNFNIVIEVLKELCDFILVVVGKEFNDWELKKISYLKDKVYHFKYLTKTKLNILYNNAFCLIYPSSYEGFGIPIVEAMKAGCPFVSTNVSSIPEVAGDAGLLVDEINTESFLNKINELNSKKVRETLVKKGFEQAKKFSWDKCFEETFGFYQYIYHNKF